MADLAAVLAEIAAEMSAAKDRGAVASYIPELALADPNWFGLSVVTVDGQSVDVGDHQQTFTIQSVSKPFTFGLAIETYGAERVAKHVGVEPSGDAFNAIELQNGTNRPFNPMVNAGAIAASALIRGDSHEERYQRILDTFERFTGRRLAPLPPA